MHSVMVSIKYKIIFFFFFVEKKSTIEQCSIRTDHQFTFMILSQKAKSFQSVKNLLMAQTINNVTINHKLRFAILSRIYNLDR